MAARESRPRRQILDKRKQGRDPISKNHRLFAKIAKTSFPIIRAQFFYLLKKMISDFLMRNPKLVLVLKLDSQSENASAGLLYNP